MFYLTVLVEDKHWMNKMVNFITGGVSAVKTVCLESKGILEIFFHKALFNVHIYLPRNV